MRWIRGCGIVVVGAGVLASAGGAQTKEAQGAAIVDFLLHAPARARALFQEACDSGDTRGCKALRDLGDLAAGKAFMAENAKKKGVKVTKSGLQYQVLREGKGPRPTLSDIVTLQYKAMFVDGKVFDSSYEKGKPADFAVGGVIAGISQGLQLMPVGSKYRFVIPPGLAYGPQGAGPIGPDQTLVIEVELLKIDAPGRGSAARSEKGGAGHTLAPRPLMDLGTTMSPASRTTTSAAPRGA